MNLLCKKCDKIGIKDIDIWAYDYKRIESIILETDRNSVEAVIKLIDENIQNIRKKEINGYIIYLQAIFSRKFSRKIRKR